MSRLWNTFLNLFRHRRARMDQDLNRELQDHLERRTQDLVDIGVALADAERRARLELGGVTQVREAVRETWTWRWLDAVRLDVRHTLRSLRRSPAFTLGTGAVLTVAIGANVALFAVVNTALLRPLDYPASDRLVTLETRWKTTGRVSASVSGPDFLDWQSRSDVFEAMAVWYGEDDVATLVGDAAVFANDRYVSSDFFHVFGQTAAAGRLFVGDDVPKGGAPPRVAVVAHEWATRHFGGPDRAIGQMITVYGARFQIIGVAAAGFRYPGASDIWVPWETSEGGTNRNVFNYQAIARLKPDTPVARADAQLSAIADALSAQYPGNQDRGVLVTLLQEHLTGHLRSTLWTLMAAAGLVLLIACANVANLQLARAGRRSREFALRAALGAGRRRVAQQLMVEHVVLLGASTAAGVLLAVFGMRAFDAMSPVPLTGADLGTDPTVVLFVLVLFTLGLLIFAATTARTAAKTDLVSTLGAGGGRSVTSSGQPRLRSALVVVEVALSVVLLVAAGLLLRSFVSLQQVDLGFETSRMLVAYTQYVAGDANERQQRTAFYADAITRLTREPGVQSAAGITLLPMGREPRPAREFFVQGRPDGVEGQRPTTEVYGITPAYFDTLAIPLRQGRAFAQTDTEDQPLVAIVNEALVRAVFPDGAALGQHVRWGTRGPWQQIVGVVADTRWQSPDTAPPSMIYVPAAQGFGGSLSLLVRTAVEETSMAGTVQSILREAKSDMPVRVHTMTDLFSSALDHPRLRVQVIAAFAAAAALLAALGIFSVLAYLVSLRTREIAVRRAVGAGTSDVVRLIVGQGARLAGIGLALGLLTAAATARWLQSLLYSIGPWEVSVYLGVTGVLGLSAGLAILVPALRAAAIAPVVALSQE
jgi:putative ABC transport system permease protein